MAVGRHLGFYRTGNCAILYCDLEAKVQGNSRSSKAALFDRAHTNLYSSSSVNMPLYLIPFPRYSRILVENCYTPVVFGAPVRGDTVRFTQQSLVTKNYRMTGLSDSERNSMICSAVLIKSTRVTDGRTYRRTDRRNCHTMYIMSHVKTRMVQLPATAAIEYVAACCRTRTGTRTRKNWNDN